VEWAGVRWPLREGERTASLLDRQRNEMMHAAAAACIAHGLDVAASRQCRCEVVAAAEQLPCVRDASVRALFNRRLRVTSGPIIFLFVKIFKHPQFYIGIGDLPDVQILPNFS
jgi:hypothetical protein